MCSCSSTKRYALLDSLNPSSQLTRTARATALAKAQVCNRQPAARAGEQRRGEKRWKDTATKSDGRTVMKALANKKQVSGMLARLSVEKTELISAPYH